MLLGHTFFHLDIKTLNLKSIGFWYFEGVPIFFVLSGFLIWNSIDRSKNYSSYLKKRLLRIYPELWVSVSVELLVIILLYGVSNIVQFCLFAFTQSTVFQFWTPNFLRGYGCGTPNGSLWTIGVLIQFYFLAWFLRKLLHGKSKIMWVGVFSFSVFLGMVNHFTEGNLPVIINKLYGQTIFNYLYLFIFGAFLAEYKENLIEYLKKYWWLLTLIGIVLYIVDIDIPWTTYHIMKNIFSVSGLIGFAYVYPDFGFKTDISYGIYLYHMTVVNILINFGFIEKWYYLLVVLCVSVILAYLSTVTVGKWSERRKYS